ncbi:MAG: PglZ domain-containing protein [Bacteroidia bacterium]|nr:PglZ domain-containing protein [Bacteroidia bacterium]
MTEPTIKAKLLWTDDEIDLLRPYVIFLEEKGYSVDISYNGDDAIAMVKANNYDLVLLDENMPGLSGIQVLDEIKKISPLVPVIMVTKSEEENIMEQAIGSKIADYLIKPVNPNQVLLAIKKNLDNKRLISDKTTHSFQIQFSKLSQEISFANNFESWKKVYKNLIYWEIELDKNNDHTMDEILQMQKSEANAAFSKFIKNNYVRWFDQKTQDKPLMSPGVFKQKVYPLLDKGKQVFVVLVDNLRLDHWRVMEEKLHDIFTVVDDDVYCSILPTSTQYSRNAMFAGLMPSEIDKHFPDIWLNDEEEGGKNMHEEELLNKQHSRMGRTDPIYYNKILNNSQGKQLVDSFSDILKFKLGVVVFNFVDILSHARTELNMIRELAEDEAAYRSLAISWFEHSPLLDFLKLLAEHDITVVLTTDHGSIKVDKPVKVVGDKQTTTNLRYKQGKNLNYNAREVFEITDPAKVYLPKSNLSSTYIFACNNDFLAYPNNFNYYVKYYKNTFQHGGVSIEEMLIPAVTLSPKK